MIGKVVPAESSDDASHERTEGALLALRDVAARLAEVIAEEDIRTLINEVLADMPNRGETLPSAVADSYAQELRAIESEVGRAEDGAHSLIRYLDRLIAASGLSSGD